MDLNKKIAEVTKQIEVMNGRYPAETILFFAKSSLDHRIHGIKWTQFDPTAGGIAVVNGQQIILARTTAYDVDLAYLG